MSAFKFPTPQDVQNAIPDYKKIEEGLAAIYYLSGDSNYARSAGKAMDVAKKQPDVLASISKTVEILTPHIEKMQKSLSAHTDYINEQHQLLTK